MDRWWVRWTPGRALCLRGDLRTGGLNNFSVGTRQASQRRNPTLVRIRPLLLHSLSWTRRDLTSKDVKTGFGGQNNFRHPSGLRLSKGAHNMINVCLCY